MSTVVRISVEPMTLEELWAVADGAPVELGPDALECLRESRQVLDDAIAAGEAIYGVTTGVGHARDERLPIESLRSMQSTLLEMHVGAMGEPLPTERVRAAVAVRLSGLARGGAGASVGLAEGLTSLLNHGIHTVIPADGSVGAGDLGQLALVGLTLLGRGEVEMDGRRVDASQALASVGLEPVTLEPKDALAVISSNAVSIGHAALLLRRCRRLMMLADLVAAVSMEAIRANPSPLDAAVAPARGSRGQIVTSEVIRRALSGSSRIEGGTGHSVQDPLSFRVVPQVHGACRDVMTQLGQATLSELNAPSDNPLVDRASRRVISNGNFEPMNLALATESLRVALGHVGLLCERRMGHQWDTAVSAVGTLGPGQEGPVLGDGPPPAMAGLALRYPAAARGARLRHLAQPVSLDIPSLDLGVEDHATNLAGALVLAEESILVLEEVLMVELLIAHLLLEGGSSISPGRATGPLMRLLEDELGRIPIGTLPDEVHRRVSNQIMGGFDSFLEEHGLADLVPE